MLSFLFEGGKIPEWTFSSYVYGPTCRSFSIILKVSMVMNGTVFTWAKIITKLVPFIKYMKIFQCTVKVKWFSCQMRPFPHAWGGIIPEGDGHHSATRIPVNFCFFSPLSWDLLFRTTCLLLFTQRAQYLFSSLNQKKQAHLFPQRTAITS